jgi:hypothetical protein
LHVRRKLPARRLAGALAIVLGPAALLACTTLLGIDDDYVLRLDGAGGERPVGAGGESGSGGGGTAAGGENAGGNSVAAPDAGPSEAGAGGGGTGGADAGCSPCNPPVECRPGAYTGTFAGSHTTPVAPIPIVIERPSLSFRLQGTGPISRVTSGVFNGTHAFGTFEGSIDATLDCAARNLSGTISGTFGVNLGPPVPAVTLPFEGTIVGTLVGDTLRGTWEEHESLTSTSKGQGTWSASFAGP